LTLAEIRIMDFVTDLQFPHTEGDTAVPHEWIDDAPKSAGVEAFGFLVAVLSFVRPGQVTPVSEVERTRHPDDAPIPALIDRLVEAGYLHDEGNDRYALVHPDRLGPVPA
jgi:hypothetical protein